MCRFPCVFLFMRLHPQHYALSVFVYAKSGRVDHTSMTSLWEARTLSGLGS